MFHAMANVWCVLSLAFYYGFTLIELSLAYAIAISFPFAVETPTFGLSGVCFALMGIVICRVKRKAFYLRWVGALTLGGFLFPQVNAFLHLYCLIVGLAFGLINTPIQWKKR